MLNDSHTLLLTEFRTEKKLISSDWGYLSDGSGKGLIVNLSQQKKFCFSFPYTDINKHFCLCDDVQFCYLLELCHENCFLCSECFFISQVANARKLILDLLFISHIVSKFEFLSFIIALCFYYFCCKNLFLPIPVTS